MAPNSRIVLCRHSQAEHNVDLDYSIPDAPLTALGKKQSAALAPQIPQLQQDVDLIITSALKRTLQSTKLGWGPAVQRLGLKSVICLPQAQECNDFPCDTGSPREVLEQDAEFNDFNLELLTPDWTSKKGFYAPDPASIAKRARWVRQYLRERPEQTIVLVAHGDILRQITSSPQGPSTYIWKNAEVRIFGFDPKHVDSEDCFLYQKEDVAAAGGYEATSSEMDIKHHADMAGSEASPLQDKGARAGDVDGATRVKPENEMDELEEENGNASPALLDLANVARDPFIVHASGRIVIPRSDEDPYFLPPKLDVPSVTEREVNNYHIFGNNDSYSHKWRQMIGRKLAVDHIKLARSLDWVFDRFPNDYHFCKQRKGPRDNPRTDAYLYGSPGHRFRSVNEFIPHALWLLTYPG